MLLLYLVLINCPSAAVAQKVGVVAGVSCGGRGAASHDLLPSCWPGCAADGHAALWQGELLLRVCDAVALLSNK
jgi:hypothetical protein